MKKKESWKENYKSCILSHLGTSGQSLHEEVVGLSVLNVSVGPSPLNLNIRKVGLERLLYTVQ